MPFLSRYSAVSARRARRLVVEFGGTQKANSGPEARQACSRGSLAGR